MKTGRLLSILLLADSLMVGAAFGLRTLYEHQVREWPTVRPKVESEWRTYFPGSRGTGHWERYAAISWVAGHSGSWKTCSRPQFDVGSDTAENDDGNPIEIAVSTLENCNASIAKIPPDRWGPGYVYFWLWFAVSSLTIIMGINRARPSNAQL